jgi:DNA modification methylase
MTIIAGFFHEDGIQGLASLPPDSIDLTVTSPPYGDPSEIALRTYGGHPFGWTEFAAIADQLWRITKRGGVLCWQEGDFRIGGKLTLEPYRHLLYFEHIGFTLFEIIYTGSTGTQLTGDRHLANRPQPLFVFSKERPTTVNYQTRLNRTAGKPSGVGYRHADGQYIQRDRAIVRPESVRDCFWLYEDWVWLYHAASHTEAQYRQTHGGLMHQELAKDLIESFSRPYDLVCDPMAGLCTTGKMATALDRQFIGFEVHQPYHELGSERLQQARRDRIDQLRQGGSA